MTTQTENETNEPGFFLRLGGFLKRLLLAFLKLGLFLIAIAVLAVIAWFIYKEIIRSFDSVNRRMETNTDRIELVENGIGRLLAANENVEEQFANLQTAVANQNATVTALESDIDPLLTQQEEVLASQEERVTSLIARTDTISGNLTFLNEGLVSLQQDSTTNVSDIDALGGEVDAIQADLVALNTWADDVQAELSGYSAEEFNRMRQAVALFRLWEMVSRARLRLIEQNVGLATNDTDAALAYVVVLQTTIPEEDETTRTSLLQMQQRLTLAASNLPDDPAAAARDLETAWEVLGVALAVLFGEQPPALPEETTP